MKRIREAAESIQRRLSSKQITGTALAPIHEERPFLFFFKRKVQVGTEVLVPFEHQGADNRDVPEAWQQRGLDSNERLQRIISTIMVDARTHHQGMGWQAYIDKWIDQNGKQVGYKAGIRQQPK